MKRNIPPAVEQRCRAILDAYGSRPARWPESERQTTLECLAQSQQLQNYCRQIEDLEQRIEAALQTSKPDTQTIQDLQHRILNSLPAQHTRSRQQPRMAAWLSLPQLVLGGVALALVAIALPLMLHHSTSTVSVSADSAYEVWAWYDITGQNLSNDDTGNSMSMTEFVELDEPPGNG